MKWSSKMLQNLSYFRNTKTHAFPPVYLHAVLFFLNKCCMLHLLAKKLAKNKKRK